MTAASLASNDIVLTDRAAKRIGRILFQAGAGNGAPHRSGGRWLLGFQYEYNLVKETPTDDDLVLSNGEATVLDRSA